MGCKRLVPRFLPYPKALQTQTWPCSMKDSDLGQDSTPLPSSFCLSSALGFHKPNPILQSCSFQGPLSRQNERFPCTVVKGHGILELSDLRNSWPETKGDPFSLQALINQLVLYEKL